MLNGFCVNEVLGQMSSPIYAPYHVNIAWEHELYNKLN